MRARFAKWDEVKKKFNRSINANDINFNVVDVECGKCGERVNGTIFLDRRGLTITDSWGFMVFSDGTVCDECLGEKDGTIILKP